ncbi:dual specificity protein kinase shkD isoform X2 [Myxocyprinus asiaticus]|uniref:dual specificity protein kinase shkD isoform X2 n=1 Tax=Myxocyprinus asiaticus TaxID=70543 RepID=UPI002223B0FE|nr:dual specificity protein kinase shkD isoform X2 [Myxocyprinus asiaticus]
MKDMGRCGNVAFCALVLFYCSFITGDHLCVSSVVHVTSSPSVHSSVKRRDGVSDVNMTSSPQPESPNSDKTQSSTNHTNINITEPTPHTHASAVTSILSSGALAPSPTPAENISFSGNFTDIRNESDVSPVKYQTRVNTPTTLLPSTTNDPKTKIHNTTFHSTSNTAGISRPPSHESTTTRTRITSLTTRSPPATTSTVTTVMPVNSSPVQAKAHVDTPTALNVGDDGRYVGRCSALHVQLLKNMDVLHGFVTDVFKTPKILCSTQDKKLFYGSCVEA